MNEKIKNYVGLLFEGVPQSRKAIELRNEILANLNDRFEALLAEGKSEHEAYGFAIAGLGDVDELIKTVLPDKEITEKIDKERKRKGFLTSIAVALYLLSPAVLIFLSTSRYANIGVALLLSMAAVATSILIYANMSTPSEVQSYFKKEEKIFSHNNYGSNKNYFFTSLEKFYWTLVPLVYLAVSFYTHAWHISWLIFIAAIAVWQGVKLLIIWSNYKNEESK